MPIVAVVGPGAMGAAVARLLVDRGAEVWTSLEGRSAASAARAAAAGMKAVPAAQLAGAEFILSILPPANALSFAREISRMLPAARHKPVFVDCNAVNPDTVQKIDAVISAADCPFVDACIIGPPPGKGAPCPRFYACGDAAKKFSSLGEFGLDVRTMDAPVGAASALKMCYSGINKGITTLVTAMILAATRTGAAEALRREYAESDPEFLASMDRRVTSMFPKAYRWVAEMQEIAAFAGDDAATRKIFAGAAELYERIAAGLAGNHVEIDALRRFVKTDASP